MKRDIISKLMLVVSLILFLLAVVLPFFAITPIIELICSIVSTEGRCAPSISIFAFFGTMMVFALAGMALIIASQTISKSNRK